MEAARPPRRRYGLWLACAGTLAQLAGLGWDAVLHQLAPDLASHEEVFTLTNPSHALFAAGLVVAVLGLAWEALLPGGGLRRSFRAQVGAHLLAYLLVAGSLATGWVGLSGGGILGGQSHGPGAPPGPTDDPRLAALFQVVRESGTEQALARLEEQAAADRTVLAQAHTLAHAIGRYAFTVYREAPVAFAHCRETFQSGCYHGVLEAFLDTRPRFTTRDVGDLCGQVTQVDSRPVVAFQCYHGLGHGLTATFGHDVRRALRSCDALPGQWERGSCYGGVFMENVTLAFEQRNGISQLAHQHPGQHKPALKEDDPLYPCDALEERYLGECYLMQTSAIVLYNHYDFARAFDACDRAPAPYTTACYQSLGRDVSGYTLRDVRRTLELCGLGGPAREAPCFVGAVKNFIDVTWRADQAFPLCAAVPAGSRPACHQAIGEELLGILPDDSARAAECARAGHPNLVRACRAGARLS